MDTSPSSDRVLSDRAKGEKLKFIFETLNKDKKRYDRIRANRLLTSEENLEYEEICRKLKSFYEKCSIFIKARKNGPGKFLVDSYVSWCSSKEIKSKVLSNRIYDEILWANPESKKAHSPQEVAVMTENKKIPVIQQSPFIQTMRNNIEINQNKIPFLHPLQQQYSNSNINLDPRSPHKFSKTPTMNFPQGMTPQFPQAPLMYANPRSPPLPPRNSMGFDSKNVNENFPKFKYEKSGMMKYPSNFQFDNNSSFNAQEHLHLGNLIQPFMPSNTTISQVSNISTAPQEEHINESYSAVKSKIEINSLKREEQAQYKSKIMQGSLNSNINFHGNTPRINHLGQRPLNSERYISNISPHSQSVPGYNPNNIKKDTGLTLDDIVPIGSKDAESFSNYKSNNGHMNELSNNSNLDKTSKMSLRNSYDFGNINSNEIDNPNCTPMPRNSTPPNLNSQYNFNTNKGFYSGSSNTSNLLGQPIQRAFPQILSSNAQTLRPSINDNKSIHNFMPMISKKGICKNVPNEPHNSLLPNHPGLYPNGNNNRSFLRNTSKTIIKAVRRNVSSDNSQNCLSSTPNTQSAPNIPKITNILESQQLVDEFIHDNTDLGIFSANNKKPQISSFQINLSFSLLIKSNSELAFLRRKVLALDKSDSDSYYTFFDSVLHRTLFIGFMIANSKRKFKVTSADLELSFKKIYDKSMMVKKEK